MAIVEKDEELDQAVRLRTAIRALVRRFSISERADVSCCGMTVAQAATLEALACCGEMRLSQLSRQLGISPSTLSRNFRRLESRGLVKKRVDPQDGRAAVAILTERGRGVAADLENQELDFAQTIIGRLPEKKRRELIAGLDLLLAAVRDATRSCCGGAFDHLMTDGSGLHGPSTEGKANDQDNGREKKRQARCRC